MTNCINYIYLHIPFCLKKCSYCSFCSFPLLKYKDEYINSLIKEIKHFYQGNKPKTIYFGGGTPSLLEVSDFERILKCFNFDNSTEITIEVNPYNISFKKLKDIKTLGVNRISIGVQSFDDEILEEIGRLHRVRDVYETLDNIKKAGFNNFSIDLIYGLPKQTLLNWENTLNSALKLNSNHISLYGLKIEKGSYYFKYPPKDIADSDTQAKMYELATEKLKEKFEHYEFSNFAKTKEFYSKHNIAYWKRENYFGFGLSASGFIENKRYTNTFNFKDYLKNPIQKEYELLTKEQELEEEIFLGLRLTKGINFKKINEKFNIDIFQIYKDKFERFLKDGFMEKTEFGIKLSLKGILVSNEILCEFINI